MIKLSGSSYSLTVVIAITLVFIGLALRLVNFSDKLLPLLIAGLVFILAVVELWREISARGRPEPSAIGGETSAGERAGPEGRGYLTIGVWLVGYGLGICFVGFIIASPLFVLLYMQQHGARWRAAIISAILCAGIIYYLFEIILKVDLYPGLLSIWLGY